MLLIIKKKIRMGFVTAYMHRVLCDAISGAITKIESLKRDDKKARMLDDLKNDQGILEEIYAQCQARNQELKELYDNYLKIHRKTRVKLRIYQQNVKRR